MGGNIFNLVDDVQQTGRPVIKVVGVGGGGGNAVEHMVNCSVEGVELICANTDMQMLGRMHARTLLQLGTQVTRGLGAGMNPEVGRQAAMEDRERIREVLTGADMVFVTAGMGGGTGTGAAPIIAEVAKEMGILTVGVVTKPFYFENKKRMEIADNGIQGLAQHVDSLIVIPNDKLLKVLGKVSLADAFKAANNVLLNAVQGIADMILRPGTINVDFADVRTVMSEQGLAMMGVGSAKGDDRARRATEMAIHSPLLDDIRLDGARGVLVSIATNGDLGLEEFTEVGEIVHQFASDSAYVIIGTAEEPALSDELRVTVVATGLAKVEKPAMKLVQAAATANAVAAAAGGAVGMAPLAASSSVPANINRTPSGQDYSAFDEPAWARNRKVASSSNTRGDINLLDIPTFLRNQAD